MINVVGMNIEEAASKLTSLFYKVEITEQESQEPDGTVLEQSIPAGSDNDAWTVAGSIGYTHMDNYNSFYIAPYARWTFFKKDFLCHAMDVCLLYIFTFIGASVGKVMGVLLSLPGDKRLAAGRTHAATIESVFSFIYVDQFSIFKSVY